MTERILHWACRLFLGGIFVYAGYTKVENPLQFAAAIEAYKLLPPSIVLRVVEVLPWMEIVLGVCLLAGIMVRYTAGLAGSLLAFFIAVMLVTYLRGIEADCGCFGIGERISPLTLVRDTLFLLPAVFLVAQPWIRARRWLPRHSG
jgi:uncharacterized membrane protein YphA (DoxX/SURF4 family)